MVPDIPEGAPVTAIVAMKRDPDLRSVRVGRRAVTRLRSSEIAQLGIAVGMPWTSELALAAEAVRTRRDALRILGRRAASSAALGAALARRGHSESRVREVLDDLRATGRLDDEAYARDAAERLTRRRVGADLVARTLVARGVEPALAAAAAGEALAGREPVEEAAALAGRRRAALSGVPRAAAARRIAGLLGRRGFDADTIAAALERAGLSGADEAG